MSRRLETIQRVNTLNHVEAFDEPGAGGANHVYQVIPNETDVEIASIQFQNGPRNEDGSIPGVLDSDLLEIVRDRLQCFENGPFHCEENLQALKHVEEALVWMNKRVVDRAARDVLGKNKI